MMTNEDVFKINQEANERLAEMATGDAGIRRARHKDVMELITKLCIEIVGRNGAASADKKELKVCEI